jgi:hypothetical protein
MITVTLLGLAACGGGGGGGGSSPPPDPVFVAGTFMPSASFANQCARPRTGADPSTGRAFPDMRGSVALENNFLRSRANETYLWYQDIVDQDPRAFTDPLIYFDTLKTMATTPSGRALDQFHFTIPTAVFDAFSNAGITAGYGFDFVLQQADPPRVALINLVEPGSPAASATLGRGDRLLSIDGIDVINAGTQAEIDRLNAALAPQSGETHVFVFEKRGSSAQQTVTLTAGNITSTPVQKTQLIPGTSVGYMLFNDHIATAETGLINAITTLKNAGATDLVLDIRYNGGGFLDIANELAFMIAGPGPTAGMTFERLVFNDKSPSTNPVTGQPLAPTPFTTQAFGFSATPGMPLPSLNLSRVFVLTTSDTCSASESIINSLRGIGVQVIQIGGTTCGKPFGFFPEPNCGTTYFSIQFRGVNAQGFGDYSDGFSPTVLGSTGPAVLPGCPVLDDFSHELGDPNETMLDTALGFAATGACAPASMSPMAVNKSQLQSQAPSISRAGMFRSPQLENRWLR